MTPGASADTRTGLGASIHHCQSSTRQGFFWWEFDPTYYTLRALGLLGIVWDIKEPPKHVVVGHKVRTAA